MLPDTQNYSASYPDTFTAQTQWIVDHAEDLNIQMVLHVGDVVNLATDAAQWANAVISMNVLQTAEIPNLVVRGNHDITVPDVFNTHFPPARYTGKTWFSGGFYDEDSSLNVYSILTIGSADYLFMALDWQAAEAVVTWADGIIAANSDKTVILATHNYLNVDGSLTTYGQTLWDSLIKKYANILLVNCGHLYAGVHRRAAGTNGNIVNQSLTDYQTDPNGGDGYLRVLYFKPARREILAKTYSPTLDSYKTDAGNYCLMSY